MDRGAATVKIVAIGDYTADARWFAEGKAIELISGEALLAMVREMQTAIPASAATTSRSSSPANTEKLEATDSINPACPKCGATMIKRLNRKSDEAFLGCVKYPYCRGTKAA